MKIMSGLVDQDITYRVGWFTVQIPQDSRMGFATQSRYEGSGDLRVKS